MKILRTNELNLVIYLKNSPFFSKEMPIQCGVQYVTESGVIVNFHYSEKAPLLTSVTIQRDNAHPEHAALIRHFAQGLEAKPASTDSVEAWNW